MLVLDASKLETETERQRAFVILSFLTHGYVWGKQEPVSQVVLWLIVDSSCNACSAILPGVGDARSAPGCVLCRCSTMVLAATLAY